MSYSFAILRQQALSYSVKNYALTGISIGFSATDELEQNDGCDTFWLMLLSVRMSAMSQRHHLRKFFGGSKAGDDLGWLLDNRIPFTIKLSIGVATPSIVTLAFDIVIADKKDASLFKLFRR